MRELLYKPVLQASVLAFEAAGKHLPTVNITSSFVGALTGAPANHPTNKHEVLTMWSEDTSVFRAFLAAPKQRPKIILFEFVFSDRGACISVLFAAFTFT